MCCRTCILPVYGGVSGDKGVKMRYLTGGRPAFVALFRFFLLLPRGFGPFAHGRGYIYWFFVVSWFRPFGACEEPPTDYTNLTDFICSSRFGPFGACEDPPTDNTDHTDFICSSRFGPCGVLPQALISRMTSERRRRITRMEAELACCSATKGRSGLFLCFFFMAVHLTIFWRFSPKGNTSYTWPEAMNS